MRIQQFQVSLVDQTRKQLPPSLRDFDVRSFFTVVKLSYQRPKIHYEVWVRGKERLVEVGLHFEADKAMNDGLLAYFNARAFEVYAELGPRVEIERWTNLWSRIHEVVPYQSLDAELVERLAERLARMMTVLQPMLDDYFPRQHTPAALPKRPVTAKPVKISKASKTRAKPRPKRSTSTGHEPA